MKMFEVASIVKALNSERQINTAVIDCLKHVESKMALAEYFYCMTDDVPDYVEQAVKGLQSWVEHAANK